MRLLGSKQPCPHSYKATRLDGAPKSPGRICPLLPEWNGIRKEWSKRPSIGYQHTINTAEVGRNLTYSITNTYSPVLINVTATNEWKATTGIDISGKKVASLVLPLQRRVGTELWENVVDSQGKLLTYDFGNQVVPAGNSSPYPYMEKPALYLPLWRNYEYRIYQETAPAGCYKSGEGLHSNTYDGMSPGGAAMMLTVGKSGTAGAWAVTAHRGHEPVPKR